MSMFDTVGGDAPYGEHDDPDYQWVRFRIRFSNGSVQDIHQIREHPIPSDFARGKSDDDSTTALHEE